MQYSRSSYGGKLLPSPPKNITPIAMKLFFAIPARRFLFGALCLAGVATASSLHADTTLFADTFNGTAGSSLQGRPLESSVVSDHAWTARPLFPGAPLVLETVASDSLLRIQRNGAGFVSLASAGSYIKPSELTLSGTLQLQSMSLMGIGFWGVGQADIANSDSIDGFLGFYISATGQLRFLDKPSNTDVQIGSAISGFSASSDYTLLLSVDVSTGKVIGLSVNGDDYMTAFASSAVAGTTAFTDTATAYAGVFGRNTASSSAYGYVDDFRVSSQIPEGSKIAYSLGLITVVFVLLARRRR